MATVELKENVVILALGSYNTIKSENQKFNLFMERLFEYAELSSDYSGLSFKLQDIDSLVHLCYPDRYKKKLAYLRGQQTKLSLQKLEWQKNEGNTITEDKEYAENGEGKPSESL